MSDNILGWSDNKLEMVTRCPACFSDQSRPLESRLVDRDSEPATGFWRIRVCAKCETAYLAPRPRREFVAEVYGNYYTHTSEKDDLVNKGLRSVRNYLADRYYAAASGKGDLVASAIYFLLHLAFPIAFYLDAKSRHLFSIKQPGKLLDVGCGNGEFLKFAHGFGWNVVGVDFDKNAVSQALTTGQEVRHGGIDAIDSVERFDFISLSHVLEHVYDPEELIRKCYSLLNDNGILWIETPNIKSFGYAIYRSDWRGLEPPRHLVLFNIHTLVNILRKTGFTVVEQKVHGLSGVYMGLSSERLLERSVSTNSKLLRIWRIAAKICKIAALELTQYIFSSRREYLTVIATR